MRIGIVGAGHMGSALACRWIRAGHSVTLSFSRNPALLTALAEALGPNAEVASPQDAVATADVVLLSVPYAALDEAIAAISGPHPVKPLITTVSPYAADFSGASVDLTSQIGHRSAAEEIAARLPLFQVVEAFNLTFADLLAREPMPFGERPPTIPLCGDHSLAKALVGDLVRDAGLVPLDAGGLATARTLETLATAWVQFAATASLFPLAGLFVLHAPTPTPTPAARRPSMTTAIAAPGKGLLSPQDHALILIDHQSQMAFATKSIDAVTLRNNTALVAEAARVFGVSVILTTVAEKSFSGPIFTEIKQALPDVEVTDRTTMNTWEDANIAVRVNGIGKSRIVLAGLWTSVCIVGPALSALDQGFEVYVIADACGDVSDEAHERAMDRMVQAGARPMTSLQYLLELQRDWARSETYDPVVKVAQTLGGAYGLGLIYAKTMLGEHASEAG